jgi:hypothetical protein
MDPSVNSFYCPLCHSIDAVTKVSSIVDGGSATSVGYHAAGRFSGMSVTTSTTALADKLAPPSLPRFRVAAEGYNGCAVSLIILLGFVSGAMGWLFMHFSSGDATNTLFGLVFLLSGFLLIASLIIGFIVVAVIRHKKRPRWERAKAIWEQLYYCARNDVVFLPGTPQRCVPISQISTLLYSSQVQMPQRVSFNERF